MDTPLRRSERLRELYTPHTPPRRIRTPTSPPPIVRQVRRVFAEEDAANALVEMSHLEAAVDAYRKYLVARRESQSEHVKLRLCKELTHRERAYINLQ